MPYLAKLSSRLNAVWLSGAMLALAAPAAAQARHRVTLVVPAVEFLAITSDAVRLTFASLPPGQPFAAVTDGSATYAVSVNTAGNKITGALDAPYGAGFGLAVRLAPPPGARSLGAVALGTDARDLVADVSEVAASGLALTYTASVAGPAPPPGTQITRTVTYTVTDQ